jgi:hypothetical protein
VVPRVCASIDAHNQQEHHSHWSVPEHKLHCCKLFAKDLQNTATLFVWLHTVKVPPQRLKLKKRRTLSSALISSCWQVNTVEAPRPQLLPTGRAFLLGFDWCLDALLAEDMAAARCRRLLQFVQAHWAGEDRFLWRSSRNWSTAWHQSVSLWRWQVKQMNIRHG